MQQLILKHEKHTTEGNSLDAYAHSNTHTHTEYAEIQDNLYREHKREREQPAVWDHNKIRRGERKK